MSIDTDASELSPRQMHERIRLERDYLANRSRGNNNIEGPGTWLSNLLLAIIAGLLAVAIPGQIYLNYSFNSRISTVEQRQSDDEALQRLILDGRIKPGSYTRE